MQDTAETLKAALDDLTRRVAAFEKAQKAEVEPPALTAFILNALEDGVGVPGSQNRAAARLRWCEAELARLREGLKVQPDDLDDGFIAEMADPPSDSSSLARMGREIQRHRKLVDGAK